jgi:Xaa-Pro dipeptidase
VIKSLLHAQNQAQKLFQLAEERAFFQAGKSEQEVNKLLYDLAEELFQIKKYWHKRIVRSGKNTLLPYRENPENLFLQEDDILFIDFGPVFEEWEADMGKTYVIGNNPLKIKLKEDVEKAWVEGQAYFKANYHQLTGADLYHYTTKLAISYGWEYGNEHCGHLIGNFPHEKILGDETVHYIHPDNNELLSKTDQFGKTRYWIYEIHFVDVKNKIGGFFEELVGPFD